MRLLIFSNNFVSFSQTAYMMGFTIFYTTDDIQLKPLTNAEPINNTSVNIHETSPGFYITRSL
jgi:hypothetical protein